MSEYLVNVNTENPGFDESEMEEIGNLYRIPLAIRQDAARASFIKNGYNWPPNLISLPENSVVLVNRLYYKIHHHKTRIKMLNLRVLDDCTVEINIEYEAFMNMHKLHSNGIDLVEINLAKYQLDTGPTRMCICPLLGPSGEPEFTEEELKAIGDLYLIPRKVRQAAAHASCVAFGYDWPYWLTNIRRNSVVQITKLYKKNNAKFLELRVVDEEESDGFDPHKIIKMFYEEFMHMHRSFGTGYITIDVLKYRLSTES